MFYLFSEESKMVPLQRSESMESTMSEREFRKRYQAITHRMVHRKSSAVMYSRILERTFGKDDWYYTRQILVKSSWFLHTCLMFIPELSKTAKSPSSCGNSIENFYINKNSVKLHNILPKIHIPSQSTAALTLIPATMLSEKAAPMDKPSIKLCTPSPKMIIQATVAKI